MKPNAHEFSVGEKALLRWLDPMGSPRVYEVLVHELTATDARISAPAIEPTWVSRGELYVA